MHTQVKNVCYRSASLDALVVIGWSLIIGLFAKISISLPFTPIPMQTQSILIFLGAVLFGCKRGALATALFVLEGALGLPVFAGGVGGLAVLLGPRGGYLIGYVLAAAIIGCLKDRSRANDLKEAGIAMVFGNLVLLACGALHLALFVGLKKALVLGVAPFILGDAIKIGLLLKALKIHDRTRSA